MNTRNQLNKIPVFLLYFIIATVPIVFGSIHPIVFASYTAMVLVGVGGWLCLAPLPHKKNKNPISKQYLFPLLIVICYSAFQCLPLPLEFLEKISPARATRVEMLNVLAGTNQNYASVSEHGLLGIISTILFFSLLVYFYGLKKLLKQNDKNYKIVYLLIIFVGTLEALYGLFQFLSPRIGILWLPLTGGRAAHGTIIYKNQFASFVNMCWPLAIAAATINLQSVMSTNDNRIKKKKKKKKKSFRERIRRIDEKTKSVPLYIIATGIMLLSVLFSLSRGGIIAMLLIMVFLNFLLPITKKIKTIFMMLLIVFVFAYGALLGLDNVIARFDSIGQSGITRLDTYIASIPMLLDHVWTGIGFGSYGLLSPVYLKGLSSNLQWDHSHNEYLQLIIELGVPASSLIFFWLFMLLLQTGIRLYRQINKKNKVVRPSVIIASGAFCGLLGLFTHGVADFGWQLPANLFYAVTLASLVSHGIENNPI